MFIPVNKHGNNSREVALALEEAYNSDDQILIFPSGLASRKIKGKIVDLEWKKHFITKSIQHQRDIIPVFIGGRNSEFFYRLANFRKFIRLKWNIEMFFLPDELMKHKNSDIPVYFGKPISCKTFDKSKTHQEWAEWVKELVYKIPDEQGSKN
jgi:putative hemolysin